MESKAFDCYLFLDAAGIAIYGHAIVLLTVSVVMNITNIASQVGIAPGRVFNC